MKHQMSFCAKTWYRHRWWHHRYYGCITSNFSVKVSAGGRWKKQWEFDWKLNSSGKRFQPLRVRVQRVCRVGSRMLGKGAITVGQFASTCDRHSFQFFCLSGQNKQHDRRHSCRDRKMRCVTFCLSFLQVYTELIAHQLIWTTISLL